MGAHLLPSEYQGRADEYVDLVCGPMLDAVGDRIRWIDVFCETGAFDADQSWAVLEAGRSAGLGLRLHANQLGHGPGVQLGVEMGCSSVDHCTYLCDDDIEAIAAVTVGGAMALGRTDVGRISVGGPAHMTILDAPSRRHLAYRPGVPLIWRTLGADYWLPTADDQN